MKSVADTLAAETLADVLALSVEERIALALRLGERDAALYAAANGVRLADAKQVLRRNGQRGRRASACASLDPLDPLDPP